MPKKTVEQRWRDAEEFATHWLQLGNEYSERGDKANADRCYEKSTRWLMRANKLSGDTVPKSSRPTQ